MPDKFSFSGLPVVFDFPDQINNKKNTDQRNNQRVEPE